MKILRVLIISLTSLCLIAGSAGIAFASTVSVSDINQIPEVLAQLMTDRETSITIDYSGTNVSKIGSYPLTPLLEKAYKTTTDDYLKWNWKKFGYNATSSDPNELEISIKCSYYTTKTQEDKVNKRADEVLSEIITDGMSDFEKVYAVNQWVINNVTYDFSMTKRSAYNGFFDHEAVCQGYALMIYKLLDKSGIPVRIESGYLNNNDHGWNIVDIDGTWYQLDATNNDTCDNEFFLVTDSYLKDHGYKWDKSAYPACNTVFRDQSDQNKIKPQIGFPDLANNNWAYEDVINMVNKGIVSGYPDGTYKPNSSLTYGEFIKMTQIAVTGKDPGVSASGNWASNYYNSAIDTGLFSQADIPESKLPYEINRADMALIVSNAADDAINGSDYDVIKNAITDISGEADREPAIVKTYGLGIITGYPDGTFAPEKTLTRAESAVVIARILDPSKRKPIDADALSKEAD